MDICSALDEVLTLKKRIDRRRNDILSLRTQMERCTAVLTGMPRGGSSDGFAGVLARVDEIERNLKADCDEMARLVTEISNAPEMDALDQHEAEVVRNIYYEGLTINETARRMNYDRSSVYRWKDSACNKLRQNATNLQQHETRNLL